MDKKYLEALQNLAYSFVELIEEMKGKSAKEGEKSSAFDLFKAQAKLGDTLKVISTGIKKIKDDNKKILSNQDTLISLSKEIRDAKEKKNVFSRLGDQKDSNKLKDGVKTIVIIAAGVIAIGLAFKLIGKVDFVSVMALSIALPLLAMAFAKIAEYKELKGKEIFTILGVMVGIAAAVWLSSIFLSMVRPMGLPQILTSIGIAAAFAVIGYGIGKLAKDLNKVGLVALAILPFSMVLIAAAIWASSILLSKVTPIGLPQIITSIGIAAMFSVIAYSIGELAKSLGKTTVKALFMLPIAMVLIAGAITASSYILSQIKPMSAQTMMDVILTSVALGAASLIMFIPIWLFSKTGIGLKEALMGSLAVIIISGAIMVSSLILALGTYKNFPSVDWALGTGLSILLFSPAVILLGLIAASGVGIIALVLGGLAVIGLSAVIVATSHILSGGNYTTYPTLDWAMGVSMVMMSFGLASLMLGGFILGTLGLGGLALEAGNKAILDIAKTIVTTSFILNKGNFKGGPTKAWAEGISLAIGAFAPVYGYLMKSQIMSIFGGKAMSGDEYGKVMVTIAKSIITVAEVFNKAGVKAWSNAPTKQWAEGVGLAIGAFAPIYSIMDDSLGDKLMSLFFGQEDKAKKMSDAMITIAYAIIAVAKVFEKSTQKYVGGPSKAWADGVGQSLAHFSTVYGMLKTQKLDLEDVQEMTPSVVVIAKALGLVAKQLEGVKFEGSIPADFTENLAKNIEAFLDLIDTMEDKELDFSKVLTTTKAIVLMAGAYDKLANSLSKLSTNIMSLKENQLDSLRMVTGNIISLSIIDSENFDKVLEKLAEKSEDLKELYENLAKEQAVGASKVAPKVADKGAASSISTATTVSSDMAIKDLYNKLEEMNGQLKVIASNSGNLSSYVNELRGAGDVMLKH